MRIHTLNIRAGGGLRVPSIVGSLVAHDADVTVLSEYRTGSSGTQLGQLLAAAGYIHQIHNHPAPRTNSVLLASRLPLAPVETSEHGHRVAAAWIGDILVVALYLPLNRDKVTFWREHLRPLADRFEDTRAVLIGDFNTGDARDREVVTPFYAEAELEQLLAGGWTDAWRSLNEHRREYTWFSTASNGFLLDHAYLSPRLRHSLLDAQLSHREREGRVTDHSALIVDISIEP